MSVDNKADEKPKKTRRKRTPEEAAVNRENGKLGGRPKIELTKEQWKIIDNACEIHCTASEISALLEITEETLEARIQDKYNYGFLEYFRRKSATGKRSLRRTQFQTAMSGNVSMQIHLGKQWLGQKDKVEHSGDEQSPLTLNYKVNE